MSIPATTTPRAPDLCGCALDGRYELHALIGEGAFGRVYRGRDRRLARAVAVKVIKPWWAEDADWVHGFEREAQLMARVSDPGIVQIFDVGYASEGLYYVAELVEGESLAHRLRRGRLAPWQACDLAEQLCRALASAHAQRVVHRDIKPANVLIPTEGKAKVGDFGVAHLAEGSSDALAATMVGTPKYMAPEQARGRGTSPATDVYSAGVVLYEMLAGRAPFTGSSAVDLALCHLSDPPPPLPPSVPAPLVSVIERALAKDPADRYASGGEMAGALARARSSKAPQADDVTAVIHTAEPSLATPKIDPTHVAPRFSRRRIWNPSSRRRSVALFGSVLLLLLGMVVAATLIGGIGHVRVPDLRGLRRSAISARTRHLSLHAVFTSRYSDAPSGTAIQETPPSGSRVRDGSTVQVVLSAGPAPVAVPNLVNMSSSDAQAVLQRLRLHAGIQQVPAPGVAPGAVTQQAPAQGASLLPNSTVSLSVAEVPRWRPLTAFTGPARSSVPFRIRGIRWRIVYRMNYQGMCTFIVVCSGPSAAVTSLGNGTTGSGFGLNTGSGQVRLFDSGPGLYQVRVTPGSDTANWSIQVQDYY